MVSRKSRRGSGTWTPTERDWEIVRWVLLHGLMTSQQIRQVWFRRLEDGEVVIATQQAISKVMSRLVLAGFLVAERVLHRGPVVYRATAAGARFVESKVRPAKVDLADLRHDLAVVDLWIELMVLGRGPADTDWITERQIRDRLRPGMSVGRIPDGLIVGRGGERWAIELETSSKDARRYQRIHHGYADRHRIEIPAGSPGWSLDEQLDDYISTGKIDGAVWFFTSDRLLERAEGAARKMMDERARSYRETGHLRMSFQPAGRPGLPPFRKWRDQQQREQERREEESRREEAERRQRELAERHARRVEHARDYLTPREQEEAFEAANRGNRERGGYGRASQQEQEAALLDAAQAKYERQQEKERQKQRRKNSFKQIFGGGG